MNEKATDSEFLNWLADRLVHVYGENPNVDFVHVTRRIADALASPEAIIQDAKEQIEHLDVENHRLRREMAALASPQVAPHPDDLAVDRFAAAMKEKLAGARAKGRGGWEQPDCTREVLSAMLREHVEKGDPRDVANFCMFLHQRGEGITASTQTADTEIVDREVWYWMGESETSLTNAARESLVRLIGRVALTAPLPAVPAGKPVAWLRRDGGDAWTDAKKSNAIDTMGFGGKAIAGLFDRPLYLAAPVQVAPAGWKLVPIEPTEEMMRAGLGAEQFGRRAAYQQMLSAVPVVPVQEATPASLNFTGGVNKIVEEFVEDYEMRGEDAEGRDCDYTPNETEKLLILDAIWGLLSHDEFLSAFAAPMQPGAAADDARDAAEGEHHGLDTAERVCFYEQDFYVLSNFSSFALDWRGERFDTSEAAYHFEKFPRDQSIRMRILRAPSAHEAFKIAEVHRKDRRDDWERVKVQIMREILRAKARQHEYVRRKLLDTGDRELVENSWRDDYWGWGPNRDGQNMLGKLWMEVRAELRTPAAKPAEEQ